MILFLDCDSLLILSCSEHFIDFLTCRRVSYFNSFLSSCSNMLLNNINSLNQSAEILWNELMHTLHPHFTFNLILNFCKEIARQCCCFLPCPSKYPAKILFSTERWNDANKITNLSIRQWCFERLNPIVE